MASAGLRDAGGDVHTPWVSSILEPIMGTSLVLYQLSQFGIRISMWVLRRSSTQPCLSPGMDTR